MSYINSDNNFYGRGDILQLLKKRVTGLKEGYRQNVALLGNQYLGKTSLLKHFLTNFDDQDIVIVYLELDHKDFHYFFSKFTGNLLYNYCKLKQLPLHEDLNLLLESAQGSIPHTVGYIHKIKTYYRDKKYDDCLLALLALPEVFTNETGKFCVLIFDEFQYLEDFRIAHIFQSLGKMIMTQKKCFYVVTSSYPDVAKKILSEKLSLLFGNFEILNIVPFDPQTSQNFVEHILKDVKIGVQLRNFLTDFTGGHPLYLNLFCQELLNLSAIHKQNEIYMPLLSQAVENTIFDRWGVLSRHFELILNELCAGKGNRINSALLMSLSNGRSKPDELADDLSLSKNQVLPKINRFMELGMVIKNGNFYCMKDKLFKYWIKFVYQKRMKDVELIYDKHRKQFKDEFQRLIESFKLQIRKDFSSRIVELLYCFDNEAFDLNGRKYKLPTFTEIIPFKLKSECGNYFDVIKASTGDSLWFIIIKKDNFAENDVNIVLNEAKKIGQKPERCLIISLTELDENTRLKALQERFWIWNEGELNTLLTLFDKPYIL